MRCQMCTCFTWMNHVWHHALSICTHVVIKSNGYDTRLWLKKILVHLFRLEISPPSSSLSAVLDRMWGPIRMCEKLCLLSVTLVDASVPVVTITHSFRLTVTTLPSLVGLLWLTSDPHRESHPVGPLTQGLHRAIILHPITGMHACKMTACHRHLGYVGDMAAYLFTCCP